MKKNFLAFSFVEVIVVITIVTLIAIVGITANDSYVEKSKNTKINTDILTIQNAILSYSEENGGDLPMPEGNNNFFKDDSNYAHSETSTGVFGVYGSVTEDTLSKRYLDTIPIDPRTNQYYSYGKTLTGEISYELAGVNMVDGYYESFVTGNYSGEEGPYNLIRSYNSSNFVIDRSRDFFPYNPEERIIIGKVDSFSGSVTINGTITETGAILSYNLTEGDNIEVDAGGYADIYFSDGSNSILGDDLTSTNLILSKMEFKEENNLKTKIALTLDLGTIWTKATSLGDDSEFEIYTTDTAAAVRGTIFGVNKTPTNTQVVVLVGTVDVNRIQGVTSSVVLDQQVKSGNTTKIPIVGVPNITVIEGNPEQGIIVTASSNTADNDIDSTPIEVEDNIKHGKISSNHKIKLLGYRPSPIGIKLGLSKSIQKHANVAVFETNDDNHVYVHRNSNFPESYTITGAVLFDRYDRDFNPVGSDNFADILAGKKKISLRMCKFKNGSSKCSKPKIINLSDNSYAISSGGSTNASSSSLVDDYCTEEDEVKMPHIPGTREEQCVQNSLHSEGYDLIAYAPYNIPGDIELWKIGGGLGATSYQDYVVGSNCSAYTPTNTNDSCHSSNPAYNNSNSVDEDNSWVNLTNGESGILIDNFNNSAGEKDYVKYQGINSLIGSDDFAIEINLIGKDLKRNTGTKHYLINMQGDGGQYLNAYLRNGDINVLSDNLASSFTISKNNLNINNNDFYKILIKVEGGSITAKLEGNPSTTRAFSSSRLMGDYSYINSRGPSDQWNGILNYVKIFKKD